MDEYFNFDEDAILPPIEQWYFISFLGAVGVFAIFFFSVIMCDLLSTSHKTDDDNNFSVYNQEKRLTKNIKKLPS